jgi:hypothetical protein
MPFVGSEWFWETGPKRYHNDRASTARDYDWGPDFGDVQRHFINDLEYDTFPDAQVQESKPPARRPTYSSAPMSGLSSLLGKRYNYGSLPYYDEYMRDVKRRRMGWSRNDIRFHFSRLPAQYVSKRSRIAQYKRSSRRYRRRRRRSWRKRSY